MVWWLWNPQFNPFLADMSDGSEPRHLDSAFASLAKHGVQACCMWSPAEGFFHFSENWATVTGQLPRDCQGLLWMENWHDYTRTVFDQAIQDLFSSNPADRTDSAIIEGEIAHGNGSWSTLQLSLVPTGIGTEQKLTILVTDVTEQRQLQDQMRYAQRQSQALAHSRSSFLSNMSHELRTPLNAILGFAQMLESGHIDDEDTAKDYLKDIRNSGQTLLQKINDLIELANIDTEKAALDEVPMNMSDMIAAAIEMKSHCAFEKDVTLRQETKQPHLVIRADRVKLLHCLTHLITNAIEHSPQGGVVTISSYAAHDDAVMMSVHDQGTGIAPKRLENIRHTLDQEESYFQTDIEDVGIGLAVCKEVMQLHCGNLEIDSLPGRGTIATMSLPADRIVSLSARVKAKSKQFS